MLLKVLLTIIGLLFGLLFFLLKISFIFAAIVGIIGVMIGFAVLFVFGSIMSSTVLFIISLVGEDYISNPSQGEEPSTGEERLRELYLEGEIDESEYEERLDSLLNIDQHSTHDTELEVEYSRK